MNTTPGSHEAGAAQYTGPLPPVAYPAATQGVPTASEPLSAAAEMKWLPRHFRRYLDRTPWAFCWRLGLESTVVSLVLASLLIAVLGTPRRSLLYLPMAGAFFLLLGFAPPVETLLFQSFPIFIVRALKGSMAVQIIVSTILFAAVHFPEGVATGVSAGVVGGLYFAFAYAYWRTQSRWQAFWVTAACHAIHNGIAFILLVIAGNWK